MSNILPDNLQYSEFTFSSEEFDSGDSNRPIFYLNKNINDIVRVRVDNVEFVNNYYVFNSATNSLAFTESAGGGETTATITAGNFTSTSIITEIKSAMEAVSSNTLTYTVSFDTSTQKITIAPSSGTLIINGSSTAGEFLGFTVTNSTAASVTGDVSVNLSGPNYLLLRSNLSSMYSNSFFVDGKSTNNAIARIPIHANSTQVVFFDQTSKFYHKVSHSSLNHVEYWLTDEAGRVMDLNGAPISVSFSLITQVHF